MNVDQLPHQPSNIVIQMNRETAQQLLELIPNGDLWTPLQGLAKRVRRELKDLGSERQATAVEIARKLYQTESIQIDNDPTIDPYLDTKECWVTAWVKIPWTEKEHGEDEDF